MLLLPDMKVINGYNPSSDGPKEMNLLTSNLAMSGRGGKKSRCLLTLLRKKEMSRIILEQWEWRHPQEKLISCLHYKPPGCSIGYVLEFDGRDYI